MSLQDQILKISTDPTLSPKQKTGFIAQAADTSLPYMVVSAAVEQAMNSGIICDMYEGRAPFKPRYVLPDYAKFLGQGSEYLELAAAQDFDEALNALTIIYHHVPSVTNIPVYLGQLDDVLLPYVGDLDEETIYRKLKLFWIMLDRTLPDAFMHVNIGPTDNVICRTILRVDGELKQIAPNLTFMYDPAVTPDALLEMATDNICHTGKPHIANYPIHASTFDKPGFGIVSCYNSLPLAGGANTLVRLNLKAAAQQASSIDQFFNEILPQYSQLMFELINVRTSFLHQDSGFFSSFLVMEGLIHEDRFAPMFGIYGMAEAINTLLNVMTPEGEQADPALLARQYGHSREANALGLRISAALAEIVEATPVTYGYHGRALLHAQGGISCDVGVTPGVRIAYGSEPDPVTHIQALAAHHQYYKSGISEILTIDETVKSNPQAMNQLCRGALSLGFREFSANVAGNDLVRITGYMVKLSDIAAFKEHGSRTNTTWLGADAYDTTAVSIRKPRVASLEQTPFYNAEKN